MNKPWEPQGEGQSGGRTQDVRSRIGQECNHSEVRRGAFLREQDNTATAFEPSLFFFFSSGAAAVVGPRGTYSWPVSPVQEMGRRPRNSFDSSLAEWGGQQVKDARAEHLHQTSAQQQP